MAVLWCNDRIAGGGIKFHLITDPHFHLINGSRLEHNWKQWHLACEENPICWKMSSFSVPLEGLFLDLFGILKASRWKAVHTLL